MKAPQKVFFDHTWVGWLNFLLLRWFFIRLCFAVMWKHETTLPRLTVRWGILFRAPWRW